MVIALEGDNAIARWRELIEHTDPAKAAPRTIRKDFASSIEADANYMVPTGPSPRAFEIPYFFSALELYSR